jgi:hypothetical protein
MQSFERPPHVRGSESLPVGLSGQPCRRFRKRFGEIATRQILHASRGRVREEKWDVSDAGLPCSYSAYVCVNIDDDEWYCTLYGEARDSFPSLPQGLSIRNDSNETSAGVIWSSSSAQATDWCQSCRAWVLLRRHDAVLGRLGS